MAPSNAFESAFSVPADILLSANNSAELRCLLQQAADNLDAKVINTNLILFTIFYDNQMIMILTIKTIFKLLQQGQLVKLYSL